MARRIDPDTDRILRPRPTRPYSESLISQGNGHIGTSSAIETPGCRSHTPLPDNAPPSVQSISSARKAARSTAKKRLFHTIKYESRTSHFDPESEYHTDFTGFFVLFWMSLAIMVVTSALKNIKETGFPLRVQVYELLSRNVLSLAIADGAMVGSTAASLYFQKLFRNQKGWLQWRKGGKLIQSAFQIIWLLTFIEWPFFAEWEWTAQVFFALHTLVFLMKMHSYAFYNGHLSETERRLQELDKPVKGASLEKAVIYPASPSRLQEISDSDSEHGDKDKREALEELRDDLATELTSPMGNLTFPQNLTLSNYATYCIIPSLCYELEYPRTQRTRWMEVFWKTTAVFGCIFLMTIVSEEFILPIMNDAHIRLKETSFVTDKALILAESISLMLFPFMIEFLLTFLVIWEYALGAFAELTRFADRRFYSGMPKFCLFTLLTPCRLVELSRLA